ncbi:MAG: S1C family serine protease [Gemmatimonadaceae bacterium]
MTAFAIRSPMSFGLGSLSGELEALSTRLRRFTVRISTQGSRVGGVGAGIVWGTTAGALVVTNAHVVPAQRSELVVQTSSGVEVKARVIARDRERDLAALMIVEPPDEWPAPATIGDARRLRVGEIVVALGHPLGVDGALSVGVVHAMPNGDDPLVRADIRLAPGNSGGPLATLDGEVIGVNCMIVRGLGIAIPAGVAEAFVREVLKK